MLQVTTGMVHNIGNALSVAHLITADLMNQSVKECGSLVEFLTQDILPAFRTHRDQDDLAQFLAQDPQGQEYLKALDQLLGHLGEKYAETQKRLRALDHKLQHISEIIDLQQRFVGELGTEEQIGVEDPIDNAITIVSESAEKRGISIRTAYQPTERILADRTMLTQVFLNLLINAIQSFSTEDNGEPRTITVSSSMEDRDGATWVTCSVADNGPGIPAENLDRIFELGFTTRKNSTGGKGLGLHFCQQTLKKYGGLIEVKSQPGQGSAFHIYLKT